VGTENLVRFRFRFVNSMGTELLVRFGFVYYLKTNFSFRFRSLIIENPNCFSGSVPFLYTNERPALRSTGNGAMAVCPLAPEQKCIGVQIYKYSILNALHDLQSSILGVVHPDGPSKANTKSLNFEPIQL